jgi:GNAT acetyltransferase-like protein
MGGVQTIEAASIESRDAPHPSSSVRCFEPIAAPEDPRLLAQEVHGLKARHTLYAAGDFVVLVAQRPLIPRVMNEIGRLRETSFRRVGEGTGKALDIDAFDDWYLQVFVWHRKEQQVLGAYRLCMTDVVRQRHGDAGLYTKTLFSFDGSFLDALGPAVEMGRSFVRPEMQGAGRVLALLWRGIAHLLAARPRYRTLFGPVSVSSTYSEGSRQLIASGLSQAEYQHPLFGSVQPKRPCLGCRAGEQVLHDGDVKALSRRIAQLEPDQKGLPILIREYVKLGGQFLAFSVDPDFQDAMDAFVVVNLDRTNPKLLALHMGQENYERFRDWRRPPPRYRGGEPRARFSAERFSAE